MNPSRDAVTQYMGWCPQALVCRPMTAGPSERLFLSQAGGRPSREGTTPGGAPASLWRFRNWILFQAGFYSLFFLALLPAMGPGNYGLWTAAGALAALLFFSLRAGSLWGQYEEIRSTGRVRETVPEKFVVPALIILFIGGTVTIAILAIFGLIPGLNILAVPAFCTGFAILPWPVLVLVVLWERKTGCRLYLDKRLKGMAVRPAGGP